MAGYILPESVFYGKIFWNVSMGKKDISAEWIKASWALKKKGQICGHKVARIARNNSVYTLRKAYASIESA